MCMAQGRFSQLCTTPSTKIRPWLWLCTYQVGIVIGKPIHVRGLLAEAALEVLAGRVPQSFLYKLSHLQPSQRFAALCGTDARQTTGHQMEHQQGGKCGW